MSAKGNLEGVTEAINAGADVDAKDDDGMTALIFAARNSGAETVSTLIEAGANVHIKDNNGKTAYDYALENPKLKE